MDDEESVAPPCKQSNAKHRKSFDASWQEQFSLLIYVPEDDDGEVLFIMSEAQHNNNKHTLGKHTLSYAS